MAVAGLDRMRSVYISCLMMVTFSVGTAALTQVGDDSLMPGANDGDDPFIALQKTDTRRSQILDTAPAASAGDSSVLRLPPGHRCNDTHDTRCVNHSICTNNHTDGGVWMCVCDDTHYRDRPSQQCLKRLIPGEACDISIADDMCVHGAICARGVNECECGGRDAAYYNNNTHQCEPRGRSGEGCDGHTPCVENAICTGGHCECEPHRHYADSQRFCQTRILPNTACSQTEQCVLNANCTNNVCTCQDEYYNSGHRCELRLPLDSHCSHTDQCLQNGECVENWCKCKSDSYKDSNKCHKTIGFNGACDYYNEELRQCLGNTSCVFRAMDVRYVCACDTDHFYDGHFCLKRALALEPCPSDGKNVPPDIELDKQCVENAHCNTTLMCTCDPDHFYRSGRCQQRISEGERCDPWSDYPLQCQDHLTCHYGACKSTAIGINGSCDYNNLDLRPCISNTSCVFRATDVRYVCACDTDHFYNGHFCVKAIGFNEPCDYNNLDLRQCLSNTSCVFRASDVRPVCACDTDHFYDGHFCFKRGLALEPCPSDGRSVPADMELDKQCVENAHCNTTLICECDADHYIRSGRCPQRIPEGERCDPWSDYPLQCQEHLTCVYGTCKPGTVPLVG